LYPRNSEGELHLRDESDIPFFMRALMHYHT